MMLFGGKGSDVLGQKLAAHYGYQVNFIWVILCFTFELVASILKFRCRVKRFLAC